MTLKKVWHLCYALAASELLEEFTIAELGEREKVSQREVAGYEAADLLEHIQAGIHFSWDLLIRTSTGAEGR